MNTIQYTESLTLITEKCYACGIVFAMPKDFRDNRLGDHALFYCPNGHGQHYMAESWQAQISRLKAEKEQLQAKKEFAEWERDTQLKRHRQEVKRIERRAAAGVCPFCQRSVVQMRRHVAEKHPEKLEELKIMMARKVDLKLLPPVVPKG